MIGCLKENPKAIIKIADQAYPIDNPLFCVDVLFKIILSMKLYFPRQSLSVWNFVEKFVYNLSITKNANTQVSTLIKEMQLFIENNKQQNNIEEKKA